MGRLDPVRHQHLKGTGDMSRSIRANQLRSGDHVILNLREYVVSSIGQDGPCVNVYVGGDSYTPYTLPAQHRVQIRNA